MFDYLTIRTIGQQRQRELLAEAEHERLVTEALRGTASERTWLRPLDFDLGSWKHARLLAGAIRSSFSAVQR